MTYVDRVRRNLEGCEAVSTGTCPGCSECRDSFKRFKVCEDDNGFPMFGDSEWHSPAYKTEEEAEKASMEAFREAWSNGEVDSEPSFSWHGCGICGSSLGGDREVWHYVDAEGTIRHNDDACVDCVMYLANGEVPSR